MPSGSSPRRGNRQRPPSKNKSLPVLLFQARKSQPADRYGMFWTDAREGQEVKACCPEGQFTPGPRYPWESTGRAAACELKEAIERVKALASEERRQYRLVSINYVDEVGLEYVVEWIG